MVESIGWILFDILLAAYYFIQGGTLNIVFGVLFSISAALWIVNLVSAYKKEKRCKQQMEEDKDQLRMEINKRDSN